MAKTSKTHNLNSVFLFVLVIILVNFVSSSSARLLKFNGVLPPSQAAADPALNLALPTDNKVVSESVFPCHDRLVDNSGENREAEIPVRFAGKYGRSAILSMLPKGQSGNSGPSGRTNDVKN